LSDQFLDTFRRQLDVGTDEAELGVDFCQHCHYRFGAGMRY
jgi:hypothetical protein